MCVRREVLRHILEAIPDSLLSRLKGIDSGGIFRNPGPALVLELQS